MHLGEAQRDMRRAYVNGGVGIFASGLVWTLSGLVTMNISLIAGMATLFFGGMAIHPISVLLARSVYRRGKTRSPNPMETLALQSTAFLIIGLVIAFLVSSTFSHLFFSIVLLTVAARYLVFQTVYGMRLYLILAIVLMCIASLAFWMPGVTPAFIALTAGIIELLCSAFILVPAKR
ncbi:DUF7010 family protein [Sphingorhabdus sp.]|jgi:hypothetical protein|uniref:DUF7010 family protein n=1 Tax=Sphingorhabdus sp. TaxID=1902408 RepID=UPI0037CAAB9A